MSAQAFTDLFFGTVLLNRAVLISMVNRWRRIKTNASELPFVDTCRCEGSDKETRPRLQAGQLKIQGIQYYSGWTSDG